MWTPKRVLLLVFGTGVFITGFIVYAFFLGGIDGFPQLPKSLLPGKGPVDLNLAFDAGLSDIDLKLQQAFGLQCSQMKQRVKFEVRKKNLVVAAEKVSFNEPDGRVKLEDASAAMFKYHDDPGQFPEITTITSPILYLTFDQKIENPTDINKARVVGGELRGKTTIINNHSTSERHDDLEVDVANEPIFYDDRAGKIWTDGVVVLLDKQTKPHPTKVSGKGLEIYLVKEPPKGKNAAKGAAATRMRADLSDVELIVLRSMVEMHLFTDARSGFMTASDAPPPEPRFKQQDSVFSYSPLSGLTSALTGGLGKRKVEPEPTPKTPEKSHIVITTNGQFTLDVPKDLARFESPPAKPGQGLTDQVQVLRKPVYDVTNPKVAVNYDHLICDLLTLQFRRRAEPASSSKAKGPGANREIDSAHATARPGGEVVLALDSENLHCDSCQELTYQCPTPDRGSRTVLRGEPLRAAKDGHELQAREIRLEGPAQKGAGQRIVAEGPGQVDLCDRDASKGFTTHAVWSGLLVSVKLREGDREINELTFTKDAAFIDDVRNWKLLGQTLIVRLEPADVSKKQPRPPAEENSPSIGSRMQLSRVEAYQGVMAESADLRITKCNSLKVRFQNTPKKPEIAGPAPAPDPSSPKTPPKGLVTGKSSVTPPPSTSQPAAKETAKKKQRKQIDLKADDVVAHVTRISGEKHDLQEVIAIGNVHVRQEAEKPGENGVDIKGRELNLLHFDEGEVLKVTGDTNAPGQLLLGDMYLTAAKVTIDQTQNIARAEGGGAMRMPSNMGFDGKRSDKPTTIAVLFDDNMFFNGRDADFSGGPTGGVQAYQENSVLRCQQLQVELDRSVSLREGQRSGQSAKVEKVIAYSNGSDPQHFVTVEDISKNDKDELIKQSQLMCKVMVVDHPINKIDTSGPGLVASLQYGTPDGFSATKQPKLAKEAAKPLQLMLTQVIYGDRMSTVLKPRGVRETTFWGPIWVVHLPANSLNVEVNPEKLPKGALWINCGMLKVISQPMPDGKSVQTMEASKNVQCRTDGMVAIAEKAIFSETSDKVILEGSPGNLAVVHQYIGGQGGPTRSTSGTQIQYDRKTNLPQVSGAKSLGGG